MGVKERKCETDRQCVNVRWGKDGKKVRSSESDRVFVFGGS